MKTKRKLSARERWIVALGPSLFIAGLYFLVIQGRLASELEKQQQRAQAVMSLPPQASGSSELARATDWSRHEAGPGSAATLGLC